MSFGVSRAYSYFDCHALETAKVALSESSREMILQLPAGGVIPFVNKPSKHHMRLPDDVRALIDSVLESRANG